MKKFDILQRHMLIYIIGYFKLLQKKEGIEWEP